MTLSLAAITHDYVVLAADRKITVAAGSRRGQTIENDICKIVNLCNLSAIAYTGLAELEGRPTHEWIAWHLAEGSCQDPGVAAETIRKAADRAISTSALVLPQEFLLAGWGLLADKVTLRSHFRIVSNMRAADGAPYSTPSKTFSHQVLSLSPETSFALFGVGQPPEPSRIKAVNRLLRRIVERGVGPKYTMQALVTEVLRVSENHRTVGDRILCCCLPRLAAESAIKKGSMMLVAAEPNLQAASFCYFDPQYSQLKQCGPTFTCGDLAVTDVETVNDEQANFQSSQIRFLHLPRRERV